MITLRQDKGSALTYEEVDNNFNSMMGGHNFLHVQDQKPEGVGGGTFTAGAWQTRYLNTVLTNTMTGASLDSNQITLPAGKYWVEANTPCYQVNLNQARVYDITNSNTVLIGEVLTASPTYNGGASANVTGIFDLSVESVIELQHRCKTTGSFGTGSPWGTGVYANIRIWRIGNYVA